MSSAIDHHRLIHHLGRAGLVPFVLLALLVWLLQGEPPAVRGPGTAGEHQAVVGAERDHLLVADGSGGAPVRLPVRGVRLDPPAQRRGFFGGERVGARGVPVDEDDLAGREPVDVRLGEVLEGAADGRPVGVVTATSNEDTKLRHGPHPRRRGRVGHRRGTRRRAGTST